MMVKYTVLFFVCLIGVNISAQEKSLIEKKTDSIYGEYILFEGDTVIIELEEVILLNKVRFFNDYDRRYYYWFRKKTLKAYPFAKIAAEKLTVLNDSLENVSSKRKKRKYVKRVQKYMEEEFTEQLKKLTTTEGRILIKLIHRQTGLTTFELIKEIRSGWKAFWYQKTARLFKLSLKMEYDPKNIEEDYMIEDILQRAFIDGLLDKQSTKLDFDFTKIISEKGNIFHVEKK